PSFVAAVPGSATTLRFRLVVNDGKVNSAPSDTEVHLFPTTIPSVALMGPAQRLKPDGSFCGELVGSGLPGAHWVIQASSNLVNWVPIDTNSLSYFSLLSFIDTDSKKYSRRFYRGL